MKRYLVWTLATLFSINSLTAQTVELVTKGKSNRTKPGSSFEFIEPGRELPSSDFVGTIRSTGVDDASSIPKLFFKLKRRAQELGANCFKLNKFEKRDNSQKASLWLDVYFCSDSLLRINRANQLQNAIVLFLDDLNSDEVYEFYVNEMERKINSGKYDRYVVMPGKVLTIALSGWFGMSMNYRWMKNNPTKFFSFTDFGHENKDNETDYLAMYFNTKRIHQINSDLGNLLTLLLPEQ